MLKQRQLLWILAVEVALLCMVDRQRSRRPKPLPYLATTVIVSFTASPSTIAFTSSDPDVGATGSATVSINTSSSQKGNAWNLSVQASNTTLANCSSVPVSAIQAVCTGVALAAGGSPAGTAPTGACTGGVPLSTAVTQIAGGTQGSKEDLITVDVSYPFTDMWKYPGASASACALSLSYTATFN